MNLSRRQTLAIGGAAVTVTLLPVSFAQAASDDATAIIAEFTGGAELGEGGIELTAPEIAENGNTVPMKITAPGATSIMLVATGNPTPKVIVANFTAMTESAVSTRIRLAGTQDVIAVALLADGSFVQSTKSVKVTIGGCGG
jgi:sulfur-oxidizing protein SoxY